MRFCEISSGESHAQVVINNLDMVVCAENAISGVINFTATPPPPHFGVCSTANPGLQSRFAVKFYCKPMFAVKLFDDKQDMNVMYGMPDMQNGLCTLRYLSFISTSSCSCHHGPFAPMGATAA